MKCFPFRFLIQMHSNAPLTVMEPHRLSGTFNTNTNHPYYEESGETVGSCCREISDVSLIYQQVLLLQLVVWCRQYALKMILYAYMR